MAIYAIKQHIYTYIALCWTFIMVLDIHLSHIPDYGLRNVQSKKGPGFCNIRPNSKLYIETYFFCNKNTYFYVLFSCSL